MPSLPSIPDPQPNVDSLYQTVVALKGAIDFMAGFTAKTTGSNIIGPTNADYVDQFLSSNNPTFAGSRLEMAIPVALQILKAAVYALNAKTVDAMGELNDALQIEIGDVNTAIGTETTAREQADEALSGRIDFQAARIDGNVAAITAEAVTRADSDSALAAENRVLQAVASRARVFFGSTTPSSTNPDDLWIDTAHGFVLKHYNPTTHLWETVDNLTVDASYSAISTTSQALADADAATAATQASLVTRMGNAETAITTESSARSTADSAIASSVSTVSANLNGVSASLKTRFVATSNHDGAVAQYDLQLSTNATDFHSTGLTMQQFSDGTSRIKMTANQFIVSVGDDNHIPFSVVGGVLFGQALVTTTYIDNAAITNAKIANAAVGTANIQDGSISTAKIGYAQIVNALIADGQISSAKIGFAEVQTANIGDLTVNGNKITGNAVSNSASASGSGGATCFLSVRAGARVLIMCQAFGNQSATPSVDYHGGTLSFTNDTSGEGNFSVTQPPYAKGTSGGDTPTPTYVPGIANFTQLFVTSISGTLQLSVHGDGPLLIVATELFR